MKSKSKSNKWEIGTEYHREYGKRLIF
jgi:hypothetical protein